MPSMSRPNARAATPAAHLCLLALLVSLPAAALAQATPAVSTVAAFSGSQTYSSPVVGPDGALYGVTSASNVVTGGLIYRLAADGSKMETIYQLKLTDGYSPVSGLLLGSDGKLYGTTNLGSTDQANSTGTVYRLNTDGSGFSVLYRFQAYSEVNSVGSPINSDGAFPEAELVEGSDSYLYGSTRAGGTNGNGVIFRMSNDGTDFKVLHTFGATTSEATAIPVLNDDGMTLVGPLATGADGYLYGTASRGGSTGSGTLFRLRLDGTGFEVLRTFPALVASDATASTNVDGAAPRAGLTDGQDGRFYGAASAGGSSGNGTVYAYDPVGGVFTVLHNFDGANGSQPTGELLLAQDGKLYGTTGAGGTSSNGGTTLSGTIFAIGRDGTGFASLYSFNGSDGSNPTGQLRQLDASTFIGVTQSGGKCSQGTVFQFSLTGATVSKGITNCGRKKSSGGGGTAPAVLLMLAVAGLARRASAP